MELGNNNIEQFFKQSFENFQPEVDPKVWNNIQKSIDKSGKGADTFIGSLTGKLIIGSAAVAIVTLSTILFIGNGKNTPVSTKNITPAKNPVTAQNITPSYSTAKTQVNPVTNNTVSKNPIVSAHQPAVNHTIGSNEKNTVSNTVAPTENSVPNNNNTETNNKPEPTKTQVYADPQHPGMNMPEKKTTATQPTESQTNNSNQDNEVITTSTNSKIAKIEFTTSGSSTYAPLTVYFTNKGKAVSEEWSFGDGSFPHYEKNPVWIFEYPGEYTIILTASNEAGKMEKDSIKIKIKSNAFFIPNTFTPNGDGNNDIYKIIKNDNYPYELNNLEIVIYDRVNTKMAAFNSSDYGWDGRSIKDGRMCPQGTYLVLIKYTSSEDGKSHEERGYLFLKD